MNCMGKKILVFSKNDCPQCPAAKVLGERLQKKGQVVNQFDVDTADGLAEASFYGVMSTPTIIIIDSDEEQLAVWRGSVPAEDELLEFL
ncbi:MAG TPA: thioredoxin family protein [Proteobacteria bacterium]|nr:thioredoxin family protein [Pseudomonadota bacterium]